MVNEENMGGTSGNIRLHHGQIVEKALYILDNLDDEDDLERTSIQLSRAKLYLETATEVREWVTNRV